MVESYKVQSTWELNTNKAEDGIKRLTALFHKFDPVVLHSVGLIDKMSASVDKLGAAAQVSRAFGAEMSTSLKAMSREAARANTVTEKLQRQLMGLHVPASFASETASGMNRVAQSAREAARDTSLLQRTLQTLRAPNVGPRPLGSGPGAGARRQGGHEGFMSRMYGAQAAVQDAEWVMSPAIAMLKAGAHLQTEMQGIESATPGGMTEEQSRKLRGAIERAAAPTQFSVTEVANMAKAAATAGLAGKPGQLEALVPEMAKFADVQFYLKHTSGETSAKALIRLAHTAGIQDGPGMARYANLLSAATQNMPGDITELGGALQYMQAPLMQKLKLDSSDTIAWAAFANRMGLKGSRGGTNTLDFLERLIPGVFGSGLLGNAKPGKPPSHSAQALAALGLVDKAGHSTVIDQKTGKLDSLKLIETITTGTNNYLKKHPGAQGTEDITKYYKWAFGAQGQRMATLVTTGQAKEVMSQLMAALSLAAKDEQYNAKIQQLFADGNLEQGFKTLKSNIVTIGAELGLASKGSVVQGLHQINGELEVFSKWVTDNPERAEKMGRALMMLSAAMAAGAAINGLAWGVGGLRRGAQMVGLAGAAAGTAGIGGTEAAVAAGAAGAAAPGFMRRLLGSAASIGLKAYGAFEAADILAGGQPTDKEHGFLWDFIPEGAIKRGLAFQPGNWLWDKLHTGAANVPHQNLGPEMNAHAAGGSVLSGLGAEARPTPVNRQYYDRLVEMDAAARDAPHPIPENPALRAPAVGRSWFSDPGVANPSAVLQKTSQNTADTAEAVKQMEASVTSELRKVAAAVSQGLQLDGRSMAEGLIPHIDNASVKQYYTSRVGHDGRMGAPRSGTQSV